MFPQFVLLLLCWFLFVPLLYVGRTVGQFERFLLKELKNSAVSPVLHRTGL